VPAWDDNANMALGNPGRHKTGPYDVAAINRGMKDFRQGKKHPMRTARRANTVHVLRFHLPTLTYHAMRDWRDEMNIADSLHSEREPIHDHLTRNRS
jgi:hypothetical protein